MATTAGNRAATGSKRRTLIAWSVSGAAAIAVFTFLLPLFRIVPIDQLGAALNGGQAAEDFDANAFASRFWEERLLPSLDEVTPVGSLLAAMGADHEAARIRFGRQAGAGGAVYYIVKGEGTVESVEGRRAVVNVGGPRIRILVAPPVFGNAVRDGSGLLSVNDLPGLDAYNAISAALNQKVEYETLSVAGSLAQIGAKLSFAGVAKDPSSLGEGPALELVPLRLEAVE